MKDFNSFLGAVFDVDVALGMYHAAGASINKGMNVCTYLYSLKLTNYVLSVSG